MTKVSKTHQLIPEIGTAILGVMAPHWLNLNVLVKIEEFADLKKCFYLLKLS
jgi:hypothetical protein